VILTDVVTTISTMVAHQAMLGQEIQLYCCIPRITKGFQDTHGTTCRIYIASKFCIEFVKSIVMWPVRVSVRQDKKILALIQYCRAAYTVGTAGNSGILKVRFHNAVVLVINHDVPESIDNIDNRCTELRNCCVYHYPSCSPSSNNVVDHFGPVLEWNNKRATAIILPVVTEVHFGKFLV